MAEEITPSSSAIIQALYGSSSSLLEEPRLRIGLPALLGLSKDQVRTSHRRDLEVGKMPGRFGAITGELELECPTYPKSSLQPKLSGDICMKWVVSSDWVRQKVQEKFMAEDLRTFNPFQTLSILSSIPCAPPLQKHVALLREGIRSGREDAIEVGLELNVFLRWIFTQRDFIFLGQRLVQGVDIDYPGYPPLKLDGGISDCLAIEVKRNVTEEARGEIMQIVNFIKCADDRSGRKTGAAAHEVLLALSNSGLAKYIKCIRVLEFKQGSREKFGSKVKDHHTQLQIYLGLLTAKSYGDMPEVGDVQEGPGEGKVFQHSFLGDKFTERLPIMGQLLYFSADGFEQEDVLPSRLTVTPELVQRARAICNAQFVLQRTSEEAMMARFEGGNVVLAAGTVGERLEAVQRCMREFKIAQVRLFREFQRGAVRVLSDMLNYPVLCSTALITDDYCYAGIIELRGSVFALLNKGCSLMDIWSLFEKAKGTYSRSRDLIDYIGKILEALDHLFREHMDRIFELPDPFEIGTKLIQEISVRDPAFVYLDEVALLVGIVISPMGESCFWRYRDETIVVPYFEGQFGRGREVLFVVPPVGSKVFFLEDHQEKRMIEEFAVLYPNGVPVHRMNGTLATSAEIRHVIKDILEGSSSDGCEKMPFTFYDMDLDEIKMLNDEIYERLRANFALVGVRGEQRQKVPAECLAAEAYVVKRGIPIDSAIGYGVCCTVGAKKDLRGIMIGGHSLHSDKACRLQLGHYSRGTDIWHRGSHSVLKRNMVGLPARDIWKPGDIYGFAFRILPQFLPKGIGLKPKKTINIVPPLVVQYGELYKVVLGNLEDAPVVIIVEGGVFDSLTMRLLLDLYSDQKEKFCVIGNLMRDPAWTDFLIKEIRRRLGDKHIVIGFDRDEWGQTAQAELKSGNLIPFWDLVERVLGKLPGVEVVKDINDFWLNYLMPRFGAKVDLKGLHQPEDQAETLRAMFTQVCEMMI